VTAWQGGGLQVDRLRRVAEGVYRTTEPIPLHGTWKSILRVHSGRQLLGLPVFMPADPEIPAAEVSAPARFTRTFERDNHVLQRERDFSVPSWLWSGASLVVLGLFCALITALAWGVGRTARRQGTPDRRRERTPRPPERGPLAHPTPIGA
jgi:hypothetical protein